jgi:hypothetical protein
MGNAAYIAPISPRPLPTNVRQHGTPRGVNLSLWTSLATLPARHTLWSTHLDLPALGFCAFGPGSSRRSPTAPVSFSARGSSTATSISRRGTTSIGWKRMTLPLPACVCTYGVERRRRYKREKIVVYCELSTIRGYIYPRWRETIYIYSFSFPF